MKSFKKKVVIVVTTIGVALLGGLFISSNFSDTVDNSEQIELNVLSSEYDKKDDNESVFSEQIDNNVENKSEDIDSISSQLFIEDIPKYVGNAYISVNGNIPYFTNDEKTNTTPFENYSNLDDLGRCGVAFANICKEIMPTEERGPIGQIKPSGWHTVKYNGIIDGNYLYNRCHLIGYQLAGENANELNLITGTRYLNIVGMLEFENTVSAYVEETNNHVLYRVTPIFEGKDLVAKGVEIEAWSVEDKGAGICFNVFCYNVQPGIEIDYATGDSWLSENSFQNESVDVNYSDESEKEETTISNQTDEEVRVYILNVNTKKFHLPTCSSVDSMSDKNKKEVEGTVDEMKAQGYTPCARCLGMYK